MALKFIQGGLGFVSAVIPPSEGTVLIDTAVLTAVTNASNASSPPNVGSGPNGTTNMVMLAALSLDNSSAGVSTGPSMVWDNGGSNQNMTLLSAATIAGGASNSDVYWFGLVNPALGALNLKASWTGGNSAALIAVLAAVNASQVGGTTTFTDVSLNSGSSSPASVSNTSPSTRLVMAVFEDSFNFSGTTNGTSIGVSNTGNVSAVLAAYGTAISPLTANSSGSWVAGSVSIKGH